MFKYSNLKVFFSIISYEPMNEFIESNCYESNTCDMYAHHIKIVKIIVLYATTGLI